MKTQKALSHVFFLFLISIHLSAYDRFAEEENEFSELYSKVIEVADELGGGVYDYKMAAVVPFFPSHVRKEWVKYKSEIAERIGPIYPHPTAQSNLWENSAKTVEDLLRDAWTTAPYFKEKCVQIARKTDSEASFGIADEALVKSRPSLIRKVKEKMAELGISEEKAISKVRDALRATIIVDTPEQISLVIDAIKDLAQSEKREVVFINLWEDNHPAGYVGIHSKLLLPVHEKQICIKRNIIVEIQIHLRCVTDGTLTSVKECEHFLYEHLRDGTAEEKQTSASTLLYLSALKQCPKSSFPKYIALHFKKLN